MKYDGACHCGKLKASFETQKTPTALGVRTCHCAFCRRHGAVNISDPEGETVIVGASGDIVRYRFALRTADFLYCRHCGVAIPCMELIASEKEKSVNRMPGALTQIKCNPRAI